MRFCPYKTFTINTNHVGNPVVEWVYQNYHFNVAVGGVYQNSDIDVVETWRAASLRPQ